MQSAGLTMVLVVCTAGGTEQTVKMGVGVCTASGAEQSLKSDQGFAPRFLAMALMLSAVLVRGMVALMTC